MRASRWIGLLLLALGAFTLVLFGWIPLDLLRTPLAERLSLAIGREVRIRGELDVEFFPEPHVRVRGVELGNPPGWTSPNLLSVGDLRLDFRLRRLVRGVLDVEGLRLREVEVHLEKNAAGQSNWTDMALGDAPEDSRLQVHLSSVRVEDARLDYRTEPGILDWSGGLDAFEVTRLDDGARELTAEGHVPAGSFALAARLDPPERRGDAFRLALSGDVGGLAVEAKGGIVSPARFEGVDVRIGAHAERLPEMPVLSLRTEGFGPIGLRARLHDEHGDLGLEDIRVRIGRESESWALAEGSIRDLDDLEGVAVELRFGSADLRGLGARFGRSLPGVAALRGSAHLGDADGDLDIENFDLKASHGDDVELTFLGGVQDALGTGAIAVDFRLRARDLAAIGDAIGRPLPAVGPVAASGQLRGGVEAIGLEELAVTAGDEDLRLDLRGSVRDLLARSGVRLDVALEARTLQELAPFVAVPLVDVGSLRAGGQLRDDDGSLGLEQFWVETHQPALQVEARGEIDDLSAIDEIDLALDLRARRLEDVGRPLGVELPPTGPVVLSGRLAGSADRASARDVELSVGESRFRGDLHASFPTGRRPRIEASVDAPIVHLADIGIAPDIEAPSPPSEAPSLAFLREFDAELAIRVDKVLGRADLDLSRVSASLGLQDGVVDVRDVELVYEAGEVSGALRVDTREPAHAIALDADADDVKLERLLAQFTDEFILAGALDVEADLASRGAAIPELLSHLEGDVAVVVEEGRVSSQYSRAFVRDLVRALTSESWRGETQKLHCLIAAFEVKDGVATSQVLVADTEPATIVGEGRIDFGARTIDMRFTPIPRNPGTLSVAAPVVVEGPLGEPEIIPVKTSVVVSAVRNFVGGAAHHVRRLLLSGRMEALIPERWRPRLTGEGPCADALRRSGEV